MLAHQRHNLNTKSKFQEHLKDLLDSIPVILGQHTYLNGLSYILDTLIKIILL